MGELAWQSRNFLIPGSKRSKVLYYISLDENQLEKYADGNVEVEVVAMSKDQHGQDVGQVRQSFKSKKETGGWVMGEISFSPAGGFIYLGIQDKISGKASNIARRIIQ